MYVGIILSMCQEHQALNTGNNRIPKCDVTKNKFVKLWDLALFSNRASLKRGPCQKLPLNCNSQPKYKGSLILPQTNLPDFELVPKEPEQILKGLYGMLSNFDPLYLHRKLQFRARLFKKRITLSTG